MGNLLTKDNCIYYHKHPLTGADELFVQGKTLAERENGRREGNGSWQRWWSGRVANALAPTIERIDAALGDVLLPTGGGQSRRILVRCVRDSCRSLVERGLKRYTRVRVSVGCSRGGGSGQAHASPSSPPSALCGLIYKLVYHTTVQYALYCIEILLASAGRPALKSGHPSGLTVFGSAAHFRVRTPKYLI